MKAPLVKHAEQTIFWDYRDIENLVLDDPVDSSELPFTENQANLVPRLLGDPRFETLPEHEKLPVRAVAELAVFRATTERLQQQTQHAIYKTRAQLTTWQADRPRCPMALGVPVTQVDLVGIRVPEGLNPRGQTCKSYAGKDPLGTGSTP